jgi:transposase
MKQGANFKDVNEIRRLAAGGMKAADISSTLRIAQVVVENFMPEKPKPKPKPKAEVEDAS